MSLEARRLAVSIDQIYEFRSMEDEKARSNAKSQVRNTQRDVWITADGSVPDVDNESIMSGVSRERACARPLRDDNSFFKCPVSRSDVFVMIGGHFCFRRPLKSVRKNLWKIVSDRFFLGEVSMISLILTDLDRDEQQRSRWQNTFCWFLAVLHLLDQNLEATALALHHSSYLNFDALQSVWL